MGAERGATALDSDGQLVVARPEAVYFYTPDGRGPCFVFEGEVARLPCRAALLEYLGRTAQQACAVTALQIGTSVSKSGSPLLTSCF